MTLIEAIKTIEYYQSWRLGADTEMIHPKVLTKALNIPDVVLCRNCKSDNTYKCFLTGVIACKDCDYQD